MRHGPTAVYDWCTEGFDTADLQEAILLCSVLLPPVAPCTYTARLQHMSHNFSPARNRAWHHAI